MGEGDGGGMYLGEKRVGWEGLREREGEETAVGDVMYERRIKGERCK